MADPTDSTAAPANVLLPHGDHTLQVTVEGPEGALPIILMPSSQRDASDYDDCAAYLAAAGHRVLRPWPRGMGASNGPMEGVTLNTLADDAVFALQQLGGARPAIWLGHAFGHYVVRVADLAQPQWVRGVVIAAAAAHTFPGNATKTLAIASDPQRPEAERLAALREGFFAPGNDPSPWLHGWYPHAQTPYRSSAAGAVPDKAAWWPVAHAPILDLQAADDPWRPPQTRNELRDVLGSDKVTVQVIEGASHALPCEQPRAVAQAVLDWIRTLPA